VDYAALRCRRRVGEDGGEDRGELRIPIADQEPEAVSLVASTKHEVAGLLDRPLRRRVARDAEDLNPAGGDFENEEHVEKNT